MSAQDNLLRNQLEREKMALKRMKQASRNLENLRSEELEKKIPVTEYEQDDVFVKNTKKVVPKESSVGTKTSMKHGQVIHFVDGKRISPENAFNTYNMSAYAASAIVMYHEAVGWDNVNLELFSAIITNCFQIYGPNQQISLPAVSACIDHVMDEEIPPYEAMRKASIALSTNKPLKVYSDAVVLGKTAMIVDLAVPQITVPQEPDLSVRATDSLTNLMIATVPKPAVAMKEVIADLGNFDATIADIDEQIELSVKGGVDINETNPHRRLTKTPGLMSDDICANGKHGVYQRAFSCLETYMETPPAVVVIPDYNLNATGDFTSAGTVSRVIPLPKTPEHYSLLLFSIMAPYEEGLKGLVKVEAMMREDVDYRKKIGNARAFIHAQFAPNYSEMRKNGVGATPLGVDYVALYSADYVGTQDLLIGASKGSFDHHPVLARASDLHQARKKGLEGVCILIDPPVMACLYFSPVFIENNFAEKTRTESKGVKHSKGFYVLKTMPVGAETLYSSWIEKYIYSHLVGTILGEDSRDSLINKFLSGYKSERQGSKFVQRTVKDLRYCYDQMIPTLTSVVLMVPGYSATKAFKNRTIFTDWEAQDTEFSAYVQESGGKVTPPPDELQKTNSPPPEQKVEAELELTLPDDSDEEDYLN